MVIYLVSKFNVEWKGNREKKKKKMKGDKIYKSKNNRLKKNWRQCDADHDNLYNKSEEKSILKRKKKRKKKRKIEEREMLLM